MAEDVDVDGDDDDEEEEEHLHHQQQWVRSAVWVLLARARRKPSL